jgi:hypothetical protein
MKKVMLISIVALAVIAAAAAAVILIGVFYGQQEKNRQSEGAPDVKFITFEAEKKEIAVGESTTVLINVRGSEDKVINDTRIVMTIEPSGYEPFLLLSNTTIQLPTFLGKDARTGQVYVSVTATDSPAKEAVYLVKGMVLVGQSLSDQREFRLTIHQ